MNATTPKDATRIIAGALQMLIDGGRPRGSNYLIVSTRLPHLRTSPCSLRRCPTSISLVTGG
jgi:hypothetical protein